MGMKKIAWLPTLVTWALKAETNASSAGREKQKEKETKQLGTKASKSDGGFQAGKPALWGM